ncbi:hypothetical protein [Chitiniphilus shinanonensis]|uniref:hypothetical protein n=1 Tax=Chitiniphilus shinanonensis TaxID=553088 RepID=UPI003028620F
MKLIQTILAVGVFSVSAAAFATAVCDGKAAGTKPVTAQADNAGFIINDFQMKCSANVALEYTEDGTASVAVGAVSVKGNRMFGGSSEGGAVRDLEACADKVCTIEESVTAAEKAAGSGS